MRMVAFVAVVAVAAGVLGCSRPQMVGAAVGGTAGVVGGAVVAGPVGGIAAQPPPRRGA